MLLVRIPLGTAQTQLVSQRAAKSRNSLHLAQAALRRLHIHCAQFGARKCHFDACRAPQELHGATDAARKLYRGGILSH